MSAVFSSILIEMTDATDANVSGCYSASSDQTEARGSVDGRQLNEGAWYGEGCSISQWGKVQRGAVPLLTNFRSVTHGNWCIFALF